MESFSSSSSKMSPFASADNDEISRPTLPSRPIRLLDEEEQKASAMIAASRRVSSGIEQNLSMRVKRIAESIRDLTREEDGLFVLDDNDQGPEEFPQDEVFPEVTPARKHEQKDKNVKCPQEYPLTATQREIAQNDDSDDFAQEFPEEYPHHGLYFRYDSIDQEKDLQRDENPKKNQVQTKNLVISRKTAGANRGNQVGSSIPSPYGSNIKRGGRKTRRRKFASNNANRAIETPTTHSRRDGRQGKEQSGLSIVSIDPGSNNRGGMHPEKKADEYDDQEASSSLRRPGAFHSGRDIQSSSQMCDHGRISQNDESNHGNTHDASPHNILASTSLVQASPVEETPSNPRNIAVAKPESWFRSNQRWLVNVAILVILAIIIPIVVTTLMDPSQAVLDAPTTAPTTLEMGIQENLKDLIVSRSASSESTLSDESSPQFKALSWLTDVILFRNQSYSSDLTNEDVTKILQQFALATLFFSTGGDSSSPWSNATGWLMDANECTWFGVICHPPPSANSNTSNSPLNANSPSFVVSLSLPNNGLNGTIPPDLSILSNSVSILNLSRNHLFGPMPSEIGLMTMLNTLSLALNNLTGAIPSEIGALNDLVELDAPNNSLSLRIPSEVGMMTRLVMMNLASNNLFDAVPSQVGLMVNLKQLILKTNRLTFALPGEMGMLADLEELDMEDNSLVGLIPSEMGRLRRLKSLNLAGNFLFSPIPDDLASLGSLEYLDWSKNLFTGSFPSWFDRLPRLSSLRLGNNFLSGSLPNVAIVSLHHLNVSDNLLTGTIPYSLASSTDLEVLDFRFNSLNGTIPSFLGSLTRLRILGLGDNIFRSRTIPSSLGSLSSLEVLDLRENSLGGTIPDSFRSLTRLVSLDLNDNFFNGTIPNILGSFTGLEVLDLGGNAFAGTIPSAFALLTDLVFLNLDFNFLRGTIPRSLGSLTRLEELSLIYNNFRGMIPSSLGLLTDLVFLHLGGNRLSGTIPSSLEYLTRLEELYLHANHITGMISPRICAQVRVVQVDCEEVECQCCTPSCPTPMPSMSPSVSQRPSQTSTPTEEPSVTMVPSLTPAPSILSCKPFSSISAAGTRLEISSEHDDGIEIVHLPFVFLWRGQVEYTSIVVTSNGVIWPGNTAFDSGCCSIFPVELGGVHGVPRIAVANEDLNPSVGGDIYAGMEEDGAIAVSWEGVPHFGASIATNALYFQAALYADGVVELRWGEGSLPSGEETVAGLEDDSAGFATPATGWPFEDGGVTANGKWPASQCRRFVPLDGLYSEF